MFFLVSYSDEYLSLAIHEDSGSKEKCQKALKELLVSQIQGKYGYDADTANAVYEMALKANTADDEDFLLAQYNIDIHVNEGGASIDDGNYVDIYQIINYVPVLH